MLNAACSLLALDPMHGIKELGLRLTQTFQLPSRTPASFENLSAIFLFGALFFSYRNQNVYINLSSNLSNLRAFLNMAAIAANIGRNEVGGL